MEFDFDPSLEAAGDPTPKYSPARVRKALMRGFSQAATGDTPQRSYVAYLLPQSGKDADGITSGEAQELEWVREYGHAIKNIAEGEGEELAEGAVFYFAEGSQQVCALAQCQCHIMADECGLDQESAHQQMAHVSFVTTTASPCIACPPRGHIISPVASFFAGCLQPDDAQDGCNAASLPFNCGSALKHPPHSACACGG
eukprot:scaffold92293_cov31-Tisochrysis_lutea.AAC.1